MPVLLATMVHGVIDDFFPDFNIYSRSFTSIYLLTLALGILLLGITKIQLSWSDIGLTRKNLKESLIDAGIFSIGGLVIIFCVCLLIDMFLPGYDLGTKFWHISIHITALDYLFSAFVQEILRSVGQVSIQKFIQDQKGYYAIFMSSIVFSILHSPIGITLTAITMFASYMFGLIFSRTYNLVGVTLIHFILGYFTLSLLGVLTGGFFQ